MQKEPRVLNVLVAGHSQHGKSSLIEAIVGHFPDNLDFELAHGTTASLKVIQFHLRKQNILLNFLDSPGHADFKGGIALGLDFTDILVLVVSGSEGFQARTYWLLEKAMEKNLRMIFTATKMDLPSANLEKIKTEIGKRNSLKNPIIVKTSAKKGFGIEELIEKIAIYVTPREKVDAPLSFIVLGYDKKRGLGELLNIGLLSGKIKRNHWITDQIKVRFVLSLGGKQLKLAKEGDIVQIALNVDATYELGTKYGEGKIIPPKVNSTLSEIHPRKEFILTIEDSKKFKIALDVLEKIKKVISSFDYYIEKKNINILVLGDLQFDLIKERLEDLIEFKVSGSQIKGIITINSVSSARYRSASVKLHPRCKKILTITRNSGPEKKMKDILGATAAYNAFHLDGLHVDVVQGKNEDDIAQAIAKAIEKVKIIKMVPQQDIIVKVENFRDLYPLVEKFDIEILHQTQANKFFLQVKNDRFEEFFNSLMKISQGQADLHLFKFDYEDVILSVDPGTRHFGFCLIERGELPSLWYVNLKKKIDDPRTHSVAKQHLEKELNIFLTSDKEVINRIFIGNGPGSDFIVDFLIDYFNIPCENRECVITDLLSEGKNHQERFAPPDIYLVDEFKTTKEALFRLQQGKLVSQVKTKGFVDHAIAALLIAKRGLKGETITIEKKPLKQLYDYVIENYAGSYSFSSIHHIQSLDDIQPGIYLRVKDSSKLDTNLNDGEIVKFVGFGSSYSSIHATTLSGNRIIIKFLGNVKAKRDFFKILTPVKERH